jgi:hypothetical protein
MNANGVPASSPGLTRSGYPGLRCTAPQNPIGVPAPIHDGAIAAAKLGRTGFRRNFEYNATWRGRFYANKQIEVIAVDEDGWLVITVLVKYF